MDRLESMRVFVAVASAGSFSAASRRLRVPLPTVSRKVSDLESHLGAKLFVRSTRKPLLTEVGQSYLVACHRILDDIDQADRDASGQYREPQGELIVTAPIVFGRLHVLPIVTEFLKTHPKISVHLQFGFSSIKFLAVTNAGPQFGKPGIECDLLYLACLATLLVGGSGPFSVDGWRKSRTR
jgi:DNA-binding transcriptional LysR family regulator